MRISFTGMRRWSLEAIRTRKELYHARSAISAFSDTILALCQGKTTIEEIKDFWFHNVDPNTIPLDGSTVTFKDKKEN